MTTPFKHAHIDILYVAGPMTGIEEFNYPAFRTASAALEHAGYTAKCPTSLGGVPDTTGLTGNETPEQIGFDPRNAFSIYTRVITREADAVAALPGWENSRGATAEVGLAVAIGLPVIDAITGALLDVRISGHSQQKPANIRAAS